MRVSTTGVMLGTLVPSTLPPSNVADLKGIRVAPTFRLLLRSQDPKVTSVPADYPSREEKFLGFAWLKWGFSLQQLLSDPLARAHDSIVIEGEVRYV